MKQINDQRLTQLGKKIKELRKTKGYTQETLAHECGIDRSYVGAIERGERNVGILTLSKIAERLSVELTDLLTDW